MLATVRFEQGPCFFVSLVGVLLLFPQRFRLRRLFSVLAQVHRFDVLARGPSHGVFQSFPLFAEQSAPL